MKCFKCVPPNLKYRFNVIKTAEVWGCGEKQRECLFSWFFILLVPGKLNFAGCGTCACVFVPKDLSPWLFFLMLAFSNGSHRDYLLSNVLKTHENYRFCCFSPHPLTFGGCHYVKTIFEVRRHTLEARRQAKLSFPWHKKREEQNKSIFTLTFPHTESLLTIDIAIKRY